VSRTVLRVAGILLLVFGVLFGLQCLDVIGGSAMSGTTLWAVLGPIIAIVGIVLLVRSFRTTRT